jgi:outer membrane protein assembly factor BamA
MRWSLSCQDSTRPSGIFNVLSTPKHAKELLLLLGIGFFLMTHSLVAETSRYFGRPVARIAFVSDDPIDVAKLQSLVSVVPGRILEPQPIRNSIERLYQTREFSYIEVEAEESSEGLVVRFKLRPNFFFADFRLGGDQVLKSSLSRLAQLPMGESYSPKIVQELQAKVAQLLGDAGYYRAKIIPNVQFLSQRRLVTVEFLVQAGPRASVTEIILNGSPVFERKEILDQMKLRAGRSFDLDVMKKDFERLRKLYSSRGFLNATMRLDNIAYSTESNSVKLTLHIDAGSFVYIELIGAKISRKELRPLVPIYEEGTIDQDLIEEGKRNIEDYFERQGFFDVSVEPQLIEVPSDNAYQINYTINRGEKQKVVAIELEGTQHFDRKQLLSLLKTRIGGVKSRGKFSRELMDQDTKIIEETYRRAGFEKAEIAASSKKDASGRNIVVTFNVKEGPQSHVAEVVLLGNQEISSTDLLKGLNLAPGQPFSVILLDEDRQTIESRYWDRGFNQAKVESALERQPEEKIRLVYTVTESELVKVENVFVIGNRLTKNKVVTRNINFHEGDPLSQAILVTSDGEVTGNVVTRGKVYQIRPQNGGTHSIAELEISALPLEQEPLRTPEEPPADPAAVAEDAAAADDGSLIDVMVAFTAAALKGAGGPERMTQLIQLAVAETNQGYAKIDLAGGWNVSRRATVFARVENLFCQLRQKPHHV